MKPEDAEKFAEIIRRGGVIVCAPDVCAASVAAGPDVGSFGGVKLRVSRWVAPGTICAVSKDAALPPGEWKYAPLWPTDGN